MWIGAPNDTHVFSYHELVFVRAWCQKTFPGGCFCVTGAGLWQGTEESTLYLMAICESVPKVTCIHELKQALGQDCVLVQVTANVEVEFV